MNIKQILFYILINLLMHQTTNAQINVNGRVGLGGTSQPRYTFGTNDWTTMTEHLFLRFNQPGNIFAFEDSANYIFTFSTTDENKIQFGDLNVYQDRMYTNLKIQIEVQYLKGNYYIMNREPICINFDVHYVENDWGNYSVVAFYTAHVNLTSYDQEIDSVKFGNPKFIRSSFLTKSVILGEVPEVYNYSAILKLVNGAIVDTVQSQIKDSTITSYQVVSNRKKYGGNLNKIMRDSTYSLDRFTLNEFDVSVNKIPSINRFPIRFFPIQIPSILYAYFAYNLSKKPNYEESFLPLAPCLLLGYRFVELLVNKKDFNKPLIPYLLPHNVDLYWNSLVAVLFILDSFDRKIDMFGLIKEKPFKIPDPPPLPDIQTYNFPFKIVIGF